MVDSPSRSRPLSITTSVAASFEMDAMGRSLSAARLNSSRPLSPSRTIAQRAWTFGRPPFVGATVRSRTMAFLPRTRVACFGFAFVFALATCLAGFFAAA